MHCAAESLDYMRYARLLVLLVALAVIPGGQSSKIPIGTAGLDLLLCVRNDRRGQRTDLPNHRPNVGKEKYSFGHWVYLFRLLNFISIYCFP
jgi:hypothetical protein